MNNTDIVTIASLVAKFGFYDVARRVLGFADSDPVGSINPNCKIIHVYKQRLTSGGSSAGLNVSSDMTASCQRAYGFDSSSVGVIDSNKLDCVLFNERPSHMIIKAFWVPVEKLSLLAKKYPSCQFVVTCHSNPSFLGQEKRGFSDIGKIIALYLEHPNIHVAANNLDTATAFSSAFGAEVLWAPNVICDDSECMPGKTKGCEEEEFLDVGLFCALRPMKNVLTQALAAIEVAKALQTNLRLHVITDRVEMDGDNIAKSLRDMFAIVDSNCAKLVEHKWMSHDDFIKLVATMDVGLQVSYTESFNIVTTDFLSQNVPVVVGDSISWAPREWRAQPDSVASIKNKIIEMVTAEKAKKRYLRSAGHTLLDLFNRSAIEQWIHLTANAKKW